MACYVPLLVLFYVLFSGDIVLDSFVEFIFFSFIYFSFPFFAFLFEMLLNFCGFLRVPVGTLGF